MKLKIPYISTLGTQWDLNKILNKSAEFGISQFTCGVFLISKFIICKQSYSNYKSSVTWH